MKPNFPLLALALGAFAIGVTEFTPMGMLPLIAGDLHVSIPSAGLLVSAYALGVLVGVPLLTLGFVRVPRRSLLIGLMGVFTVGNVMAAMSNGYAMLMIARIITSFNHGTFFGVGAVVAASIARPERRAAAVATMFSGVAIATIGGVPLAAWAGALWGWRAAFWGIAAIGGVTMVALRTALPPLPAEKGADVRSEIRVVGQGAVLAALALTVLSSSAMFTVYTYIVPILQTQTGASAFFVTAMLVLYGVGLTIGNYAGGRFGDKSIDGTLVVTLSALVVVLMTFAISMRSEIAAAPLILLIGIGSFAVVAPLQMRIMDKAREAPSLAAALNIGAFNLGNAIGAALGGGVINAGLGYPFVPVAAAAMAGAGLALTLFLRRPVRATASSTAAC